MVRHPPWRINDEDPNMDGEMPDVTKMPMTRTEREEVEAEMTIPRRAQLKKDDFEKFGYTAKCPGCRSMLRGGTRQGHSELCRERIEKELEGSERLQKAKGREYKFYEETLEREEKRRRRAEEEKVKTQAESDQSGDAGGRDEDMGGERETKREREEDVDETDRQPAKRAMVGELEVNQEVDEWGDGELGTSGDDRFWNGAIDDKTGDQLDPRLVEMAETEEMEYMRNLGVGEEVDEQECWEKTGKAPVTTKFVRVNKGTKEEPNVRARLVARDFKVKGDGRDDLFAAMPPLEAKKMLFRMAAKDRLVWRGGRWQRRKLLFIDVKKAHLNGKVPDDVFAYVRLPGGKVWRLKRWLYGMRPAAQAWEEDYAQNLGSIGFARGRSAPTVFYREKTGCRGVVHGDDFTFMCYGDLAEQFVKDMSEWYDLKIRAIVGDDDGDDKEVTILNRTLRHTGSGFEYFADERHEAEIRAEFGIGAGSKGLESPVEKEELKEGFNADVDDLSLSEEQGRRYRAVAARSNYLSMDRMDLQFAAKEACRQMAKPRASGAARMKRISRYLAKYPKLVWRFGRGEDVEEVIDVFSDSDWAACRRTRKSTSGGVASIDGSAIKHWSSTQGSIALSVGEAEYYALVKAVAEGLGLIALGKDLGYEFRLRVWVDSNTAKAIASRLGLGRVRHLEVKYLWAQEAFRNKKFELKKIRGDQNPADVLTKPMSATEMAPKIAVVGGRLVGDRAWFGTTPHGERKSWADLMEEEETGEADCI